MPCDCLPCRVDRWFDERPERWPWRLLGGIVALIGVLFLPLVGLTLPLLLVGAAVARLPDTRPGLTTCRRVRSG